MKLSVFKEYLQHIERPIFQASNGTLVPEHYHITEIGVITKKFIDCGGTTREEKVINFQLWSADDTEHRLSAKRLLDIISLFEEKISSDDYLIEVEYQADTIGKYGIERHDGIFILTTKETDCLAKDTCGIPEKHEQSCCGGGCC